MIITFYNCTQKAIADSPADAKVTWAHIKTTMAPLLQKVLSVVFLALYFLSEMEFRTLSVGGEELFYAALLVKRYFHV